MYFIVILSFVLKIINITETSDIDMTLPIQKPFEKSLVGLRISFYIPVLLSSSPRRYHYVHLNKGIVKSIKSAKPGPARLLGLLD